jgi:hypothetical protein
MSPVNFALCSPWQKRLPNLPAKTLKIIRHCEMAVLRDDLTRRAEMPGYEQMRESC